MRMTLPAGSAIILMWAINILFAAPPASLPTEAASQRSAFSQQFKDLDKDGDGAVSEEELDHRRLFKRLDKNHDGRITPEELPKSTADLRSPRKPSPAKAIPPSRANIAYGPHPRMLLDFWSAKGQGPRPLVVFIHGGGFVTGDKTAIPPALVRSALDAGTSVVSISYPFLKQAPIQEILHDCGRAVQFMRYHAAEFSVDPYRIAAMGGSAGAGTSLWLAVHDDLADPNASDPVLRESSRLVAAAGVNTQATYDLPEWERVVYPVRPEWLRDPHEFEEFYHFKSSEEFDTERGRRIMADCSMYSLLSRDDAPILLICTMPPGDPKDRNHLLHHPKHAEVIKARADEVGARVEVRLLGSEKKPDKGPAPEPFKLALEFLLKHLQATPPASAPG